MVTDGSIRLWAEEETPAAEDLPELDTWVSGCPGLREPLPSAVCLNEIPYLNAHMAYLVVKSSLRLQRLRAGGSNPSLTPGPPQGNFLTPRKIKYCRVRGQTLPQLTLPRVTFSKYL